MSEDALGLIELPPQSLWGMGAAIHTPRRRDERASVERLQSRGASRAGSELSLTVQAMRCHNCRRRRVRRMFLPPQGQWCPPHCSYCARRHLHLDEDGYVRCSACGTSLCNTCAEYANDDAASSGYALSEAPVQTSELTCLVHPLIAAAAACAARYVRSQKVRDLQQSLTRRELAVAAAVQPAADGEAEGRQQHTLQEVRDRLRLLSAAAEERQRHRTATASSLVQQMADKRAADAAARRDALEAVMRGSRAPAAPPTPASLGGSTTGSSSARLFVIGDHVRYRDKGMEWRDGIVAGLESGRPKVADVRRPGGASFLRDEVELTSTPLAGLASRTPTKGVSDKTHVRLTGQRKPSIPVVASRPAARLSRGAAGQRSASKGWP